MLNNDILEGMDSDNGTQNNLNWDNNECKRFLNICSNSSIELIKENSEKISKNNRTYKKENKTIKT